jgi:GTP-binding protein
MKVKSAEFFRVCVLPSQFPNGNRPEIAFVGRSNVGKSSLINKLLNRNGLARTSSQPGKTRALNYYLINDSFFFVDLPGYGYAKVSETERKKWGPLIEGFLKNRQQLVLVVQLIDIRHEPTEDDCLMMDWFDYYKTPVVVAATKSDKLSRSKLTQNVSDLKSFFNYERLKVVPFSSVTGMGADELWSIIEAHLP